MAKSEQVAAVCRPPGQGPFPLVIVLHGALGLSDIHVRIAARLAAAGFVAGAGCWQASPSQGTAQLYELTITLIGCPNLAAAGLPAIAALIAAGRKQPGVQSNSVALFGVDTRGGVTLEALASRNDIRAAVIDSGEVRNAPEPAKIKAPVLFLAGTNDEQAEELCRGVAARRKGCGLALL